MNPNLLWQEDVLLENSECGWDSNHILDNKGWLSSGIWLNSDLEERLLIIDEEKSLFLSISFFSWELSQDSYSILQVSKSF